MRALLLVTLSALLLACGHGSDGSSGGKAMAFDQPAAGNNVAKLDVQTSSFPAGGDIPENFTAYGSNQTPEILWNGAPSAKAFVLLVEDPDAPGAKPFVHWLITNIPASTTSSAGGGTPGKNDNGDTSYFGPKPPDNKPHHYHFEVFALDTTLPSSANDRDSVLDAMKGHVIAKGEVVGIFQKR